MQDPVAPGLERPAAPPLIIKLAQVQVLAAASPPSPSSASLRVPYHQGGLDCLVSFAASQQPSDLLKRPSAIPAEALHEYLTTGAAQNAVRTAVEAYMQHHNPHSSFPQLHPDPIGLAEGLAGKLHPLASPPTQTHQCPPLPSPALPASTSLDFQWKRENMHSHATGSGHLSSSLYWFLPWQLSSISD